MKKLMLMALLAVGTASFGAVAGDATNVALPIKVTGEVIEANGNLMIEATTAGMSGDEMAFNFGAIAANGVATEPMEGTFKITKADGSAIGGSSIAVGLNEDGSSKSATTELTRTAGKVTLNYAIGTASAELSTAKEINGTVTVSATVDTSTTPGTFTDTSKKVYVVLSA